MTQQDAFPETLPPEPRYVTGLADPPWPERGGGKVKRGADRHYPLMSVRAICELPVARLFRPDAHLYLWATNNYLRAAFDVMEAWGFRYVTCITWQRHRARQPGPVPRALRAPACARLGRVGQRGELRHRDGASP